MMIKILLISGIIGAVVYALRGANTSTNLAVRRLAGIIFAVVAAFSVLFPDAVTWVANRVGVGRGTDLVLYVLVVAFLYVSVALYQRIHHLEQRLTEVARAVALGEAGVSETGEESSQRTEGE